MKKRIRIMDIIRHAPRILFCMAGILIVYIFALIFDKQFLEEVLR